MKRVEVTHISPAAFGADGHWGGGERYPLALAQAMSRKVSTRLVVLGPHPGHERVQALEVCRLPVRTRFKQGSVNPLSEALPLYVATTGRLHLHQYQSVLTNVCMVLGWVGRRHVFCTDHGGASYNYADRYSLERLLTRFIPVSQYSASLFPRLADRASPPVFGGVDVGRFHPDGDRRERQVIYVGRLLPHKGIDVLLRAVDDRTRVRVFGHPYDPGYRAQLHRLAAGKNVTFHEHAADAEIVDAYRRSMVSVLPSVHHASDGRFHPWPELLGLSLLESMACGTPVVASSVGGIPEVLDDGETGFLVRPGDPDELGERIGELLDPSARWSRMSARGVEVVRERFTWDHVAERCLRIYDGV